MKGSTLLQTFVCLLVVGACLASYLSKQNAVTKLSMELPAKSKQLKKLEEETMHLRYRIEQFESPAHLVALAQTAPYAHLKHPSTDTVVVMEGGRLPEKEPEPQEKGFFLGPRLVIGAQK